MRSSLHNTNTQKPKACKSIAVVFALSMVHQYAKQYTQNEQHRFKIAQQIQREHNATPVILSMDAYYILSSKRAMFVAYVFQNTFWYDKKTHTK